MKKMLTVLVTSMVLFAFGDTETVTNVRGVQRANSKLVDVYYDLEAPDGGTYTVEVKIEGKTDAVAATTFTGDVGKGVTPGVNRHVVWDAGADWPDKKGDVKAVVTATKEDTNISDGKVPLWEGGPYWADRNIGADNPWDYGLYFWWGDTTGHRPSGTTFEFDFYYGNPAIYTIYKSVSELQSAGWVTSEGVLAPAHDAAHVKWGGNWRMPTYQELSDLCDKCDWTWTTLNGVNGYVVRGRGTYASNSIFLPAAGIVGIQDDGTSLVSTGGNGLYWSSALSSTSPQSTDEDYCSWYLSSGSSYHRMSDLCLRSEGHSVRPVQGFTN